MCIGVLLAYMSVYQIHAWCPQRPEGSPGCPETGVTNSREPPCMWCCVRAVSVSNHPAISLAFVFKS